MNFQGQKILSDRKIRIYQIIRKIVVAYHMQVHSKSFKMTSSRNMHFCKYRMSFLFILTGFSISYLTIDKSENIFFLITSWVELVLWISLRFHWISIQKVHFFSLNWILILFRHLRLESMTSRILHQVHWATAVRFFLVDLAWNDPCAKMISSSLTNMFVAWSRKYLIVWHSRDHD